MAETKRTTKATSQTTSATPGDPGPADATTEERAQRLREKVDASTLESAPEDQKGPTGGSFVNPATVGSGTIMPDGTYGAPLPDPNVEKLAKLAEETKDSDTSK